MSPSMTPLRILLVEDYPALGPLLSEALARMGHDVRPFVGAHAAALQAAVSIQPDLLIVDMALSDAAGLEAGENGPGERPVRHVFISAHAQSPKTLRPGAAMLQAPFDDDQLARVIAHIGVGADPPVMTLG